MSKAADLSRYSRQMLFTPFGEAGQRALKHARVTLIGCGALGTVIANMLARAGVGFLRIVDRDFIEMDNLQRQVLFDEHDIAANLPKAEAAARKLRRINSAIEIEPHVADAGPGNIEELCADADLILDGTDNFETRFLINDVAVKTGTPWVYGACIGAEGMVMPIVPRQTPCLRCIWEEAPPPGSTPTCETAGVLAPIVDIVASLQVVEAFKLLSGKLDELNRNLVTIDAWRGTHRALNMQAAYDDGDCPCCKHDRFDYLSGSRAAATTALCGRNAVQITPAPGAKIDFHRIAAQLPSGSKPTHNAFLLRFDLDELQVTLFADGRAIVKGTADPAAARSVYARYIGS
jgi:adenylyltransferase/sulfurtransferase